MLPHEVVLCTATQPALRRKDGFRKGFDIDDSRELACSRESVERILNHIERGFAIAAARN